MVQLSAEVEQVMVEWSLPWHPRAHSLCCSDWLMLHHLGSAGPQHIPLFLNTVLY